MCSYQGMTTWEWESKIHETLRKFQELHWYDKLTSKIPRVKESS